MKYKVVVVYDDEQRVIAEVDDPRIACMILDIHEQNPIYDEVYIVKEFNK